MDLPTAATRATRTALLCAALSFAACHGQSQTGGAPPAILPGEGSAPALAALPGVAPVRSDARDVDRGALLTRLTVILRRDATVGQVNAALQAVGATGIVFAHP